VTALALDTSVAIALLVATHLGACLREPLVGRPGGRAQRPRDGRDLLGAHAPPGDLRLAPGDAARLLAQRFTEPLLLGPAVSARLPDVLSRLGIAGGAVYDALVALAALEHGAILATRDARARATYETVGVQVVVAE